MNSRFIKDPSIILLLLSNIFCIVYYNRHPEGFNTIVYIYWFQSIIIGFFNFLDMLTLRNFKPTRTIIEGNNLVQQNVSKGCMAFFFLFHYGTFHFVYMIFIVARYGMPDRNIMMIAIAAFLMESLIIFRRKKLYEQTNEVNPSIIMFLPYLRIIPMHLLILVPMFMGLTPSIIFLILKTLADLGFFLITQRIYRGMNTQV